MMKRLYLGILAVAVTAALTTVGSLALFSSDPDTTSADFTAGTVSLGAPFSRLTNVADMAPGDSGTKTYQVTYTGSLDAWVGLDASLSGDLTTCDGGGRFTATITDEKGVSYSSSANNQVVANAAGDIAPIAGKSSYQKTFTVNYSLALATGNACQGKTATITLTTHAVQSSNNTTGSGPTSWN